MNNRKLFLMTVLAVTMLTACGGDDDPTTGGGGGTPTQPTIPQKNMTISGGTPQDATSALTSMLGAATAGSGDTYTLTVSGTMNVAAGGSTITITVPQVEKAYVVLKFENAPTGTSSANPLQVVAQGQNTAAVGESKNMLTVSVPQNSAEDVYVNINTPTTTVRMEGKYKEVTSRTATGTITVAQKSSIDRLIVGGGNVRIMEGAQVGSIERSATNTDEVTEIVIGSYDDDILGNVESLKLDGRYKVSFNVTVNDGVNDISEERKALIDLYNATDGPNWEKNANWCTDAPLKDWYGVYLTTDGHVRVLNLWNNKLKGQIPESIGKLTSLIELALAYNQLSGELPKSMSQLTKLTSLTLDYNQFTGSIPEWIGALTNLEHELFLNHNQFTGSIPVSIGKLKKLKRLWVDHNQLTDIPKELAGLDNVWWLNINDNQFSGEIPECIGDMKSLTELHAGNNQFTGTIPESFTQLTKMGVLSLEDNRLSGTVSETVSAWLHRKVWYVLYDIPEHEGDMAYYLGQQEGYGLYDVDGSLLEWQEHVFPK